MEDVITEAPPPSRFFEDELNNFASPSPSPPPPSLSFSHPHPQPLKPSLLLIALSSPSLYLFQSLPKKTLIASLILPQTPIAAGIEPPVTDNNNNNTCNIYSLDSHDTLLVSVQCTVPPERSHSVARLLIGDQIVPKRVVILDSIQVLNYRGRLSSDEAFAFKLETSEERKSVIGEKLVKGLEYYPSGSVVDGLSAALLGRCQILNIRGVLCVSWPEFDASVVSLIKGLVQREVLPGLELSSSDGLPLKFGRTVSLLLSSFLLRLHFFILHSIAMKKLLFSFTPLPLVFIFVCLQCSVAREGCARLTQLEATVFGGVSEVIN